MVTFMTTVHYFFDVPYCNHIPTNHILHMILLQHLLLFTSVNVKLRLGMSDTVFA